MRKCKHGFDPARGPGLWCPACDEEAKYKASRDSYMDGLPAWRRVLARLGFY